MLTPWQKILSEPFRIFFPMAMMSAILGLVYWPLAIMHIIKIPMEAHVWMQAYCFMGFTIIGFLTTAVPKLTKTFSLSSLEFFILLGISVVLFLVIFLNIENYQHLVFSILIFTLITMLSRRLQLRQSFPPPSFVYLPPALILAGLSATMQFSMSQGWDFHFDFFYPFSREILSTGYVSMLLIGIGGFLIKSLLGRGSKLPDQTPVGQQINRFDRKKIFFHSIAAFFFIGGIVIEHSYSTHFGQGLTALVVVYEMIFNLKIFLPAGGNATGRHILWTAQWLFLLGYLTKPLLNTEDILASQHLILIGGFTLSIMVIMTRVVFSHCNRKNKASEKFLPLIIGSILILVSLSARFSAEFFPEVYTAHLEYGASVWILGLIIWAMPIMVICFKNTFSENEFC